MYMIVVSSLHALCSVQSLEKFANQITASIHDAAATVAFGLMKYYKNNATNTPAANVGLLDWPPYYWWESGAMWGAMIDYSSYTKDSSYDQATTQGMLAQVGPDQDYIVPEHHYDEVCVHISPS